MCGKNEKKISIIKVVAITSTVVLSVLAIGAVLYKLFSKYFKITFECDSNCEDCVEGCCCDEAEDVLCDCGCGCECEDEAEDEADVTVETEDAPVEE